MASKRDMIFCIAMRPSRPIELSEVGHAFNVLGDAIGHQGVSDQGQRLFGGG